VLVDRLEVVDRDSVVRLSVARSVTSRAVRPPCSTTSRSMGLSSALKPCATSTCPRSRPSNGSIVLPSNTPGREDDESIARTYHEAVQAAWLAEPYPVRAALTRTGVAFAPMGTYGGFSVEGINEFGSGLLAELHDVDAFDWEGTRIAPTDAGASEPPS
jgi:hypothetical protein